MQISKDQMIGMLAGNDMLLRLTIQKQVREEHSYVVEDLPQELFDEMVDRGIRRARDYGLSHPSDLACFVLLMFEFGPEFWRHPAIGNVLQDATSSPSERLQQVVNGTPNEVWRYLESAMHKQRWFPEAFEADGTE